MEDKLNKPNNLIELDKLDEDDVHFNEFVEQLKEKAVRAVFIIERDDGSFAVGSNSTDKRDLVMDLYRVQKFIERLLDDAEEDE